MLICSFITTRYCVRVMYMTCASSPVDLFSASPLVPAAVSFQWLLYGGQESWGRLPGLWDLQEHMDALFFYSEAIQFLFRSDGEMVGGYLWNSPALSVGDITQAWHYCRKSRLTSIHRVFFSGRLITNESVIIQNIILKVAPGFICKNDYGAIISFILRLHIGSCFKQEAVKEGLLC